MSFRQLDLCSADELLQKLQSKLQDEFCQFQDIFDRWSELRENPPAKPDGYFFQLLAEEVVKVIFSLDGDFELIRNFSAIIPSTHCVNCYPNAAGRVQYFTLLSDSRHGGLRGEIYSASVDNSDGEAEIFHMADLDFTVNDSNAWKEVVDQSRKEGWLRCLLDLLTWKLEYCKIEYGACGSYLRRKQIEIVKELDALPFHLHVEVKICTEENCFGTLGNVPVRVHYYSKGSMESDDDREKALQKVLDARNLRHPNLVTWSSVDSGSPDKWALVTPRLTQTLSATLESNQGNDQFKVAAIKDIASGLDYLYRKETWHGSLRSTNILVSSASNPRVQRFVLSGFVPLTKAGPLEDAFRIRNTKGEFISPRALEDVDKFGRIIYELYPDELAFDSKALEESYLVKAWHINRKKATPSPEELAISLISKSLSAPQDFPLPRIARYVQKTCANVLPDETTTKSEQSVALVREAELELKPTEHNCKTPSNLPANIQEAKSIPGSVATSQTLVEFSLCGTLSKVPSTGAQPLASLFPSASDVIKAKRMSQKNPLTLPTPVSSEDSKERGIGNFVRNWGSRGLKGIKKRVPVLS